MERQHDHYIVEFEQGGAERAEYGTRLLERLSERLTSDFGKGFDASNLYKMSQFYRLFPKLDALRPELSWTHYRLLLRLEEAGAREWYMNEAASQNWSTRALQRQIGTLYYERLLASRYKLVLPSEKELRAGLMREQRRLENDTGTAEESGDIHMDAQDG